MSDLISRNEAWKAFDKWQLFVDREDRDRAQEVIESLPAIAAKPAVYGEWIEIEKQGRLDHVLYNTTPRYRCSVCGNDAISAHKEHRGHGDYYVEYQWFATSFCPNCGADMRKIKKVKQ